MGRVVCWWSDGAASAVATMLTLKEHPEALIVTCDTGAEHEDNLRFRFDCERRMNRTVEVLTHQRYDTTWDVWEHRRFMSSPYGAPCSTELKYRQREAFQLPGDIQVFGYTADQRDVERAKRLDLGIAGELRTPLIERGITKAGCLAMLMNLGIAPPETYALGFSNANCVKSGCCKATSPDYWALVRKVSPEGFARTAAIAREIGAKPVEIHKERVSLDDLPADWPTLNPIAPACDFLCHLAEKDVAS